VRGGGRGAWTAGHPATSSPARAIAVFAGDGRSADFESIDIATLKTLMADRFGTSSTTRA